MTQTPFMLQLIAALVIGLSVSTHCALMCGPLLHGIQKVSSGGLDSGSSATFLPGLWNVVLANLSRLFVYALLGFTLAGSSALILNQADAVHGDQIRRLLAGATLLLIGLHISRIWQGLIKIEALGFRLWQRCRPWLLSMLPQNRLGRCVGLGLCWGFLPCGMTFSALLWSANAATPMESALLMSAFGAGTLPAVIGGSAALAAPAMLLRKPVLTRVTGIALTALGCLVILDLPLLDHSLHRITAFYNAFVQG